MASFPAKGNSKSKGGLAACSILRYMVANNRAARVLRHYLAVFFCTPPPFFGQTTQRRVCFFNLFSKPYVKLHSPRSNNQNIQRNKASRTSDTALIWPISGACGYLQHPKQFTGVSVVIKLE